MFLRYKVLGPHSDQTPVVVSALQQRIDAMFPNKSPCNSHLVWLAGELKAEQPGAADRSAKMKAVRRGGTKDQAPSAQSAVAVVPWALDEQPI